MSKIKIENVCYVYDGGTPFETVALNDINIDIRENTVCVIILANLCDLIKKIVKIRRIEAESVISGNLEGGCPCDGFILVAEEPFGMFSCGLFIKTRGNIDGSLYTDFMSRFDLCAKQVKIKIGVHFVCLGGVVCPTVVAFRKNGNGINVAGF